MTQNTKYVLSALIALGLAVVIWGAYQYPKVQQALQASPAGTSFGTQKQAAEIVQVSTSTVYSQLNTDSNDRTITGAEFFLTGGTSTSTNYAIACATSSVASTITGNTNYTLLAYLPSLSSAFGTTSGAGVSYMASSSPGIMGTTSPQGGQQYNIVNPYARVWKTGTYLNCSLTTSAGSVDNLFDANVTGYINFTYRSQ